MTINTAASIVRRSWRSQTGEKHEYTKHSNGVSGNGHDFDVDTLQIGTPRLKRLI
jgi:hypothetical protein